MGKYNYVVFDGETYVSQEYVKAVAYVLQKLSHITKKPILAWVVWDDQLKKFDIDVDADIDVVEKLRKWVWDTEYDDYVHIGIIPKTVKNRLKKLLDIE